MAKRLVRAKDFESAIRYPVESAFELGDFEMAAVKTIVATQKGMFPLMYQLVEGNYGPEGHICFIPPSSSHLGKNLKPS